MPGLGRQPKSGPPQPPVFHAPGGAAGFGGSGPVTPKVVGVGPVGGAAATGPFGAGGTPQATNTAQENPAVKAWLEKVGQEFGGAPRGGADPYLEESIGNLRTRQATDTTDRAVQRAEGKIKDQAAGQRAMLKAGLGRRVGGGQAGLEEKLGGKIDAASQRLQAGAAADIMLGRERDLDNLAISGHNILSAPSSLALARSGQAHNVLGMGLGGANTLAQIGLADRSLNLQQWQALMADERSRAEMAAAEQARREGQQLALKQMDLQAQASGLTPTRAGVVPRGGRGARRYAA